MSNVLCVDMKLKWYNKYGIRMRYRLCSVINTLRRLILRVDIELLQLIDLIANKLDFRFSTSV